MQWSCFTDISTGCAVTQYRRFLKCKGKIIVYILWNKVLLQWEDTSCDSHYLKLLKPSGEQQQGCQSPRRLWCLSKRYLENINRKNWINQKGLYEKFMWGVLYRAKKESRTLDSSSNRNGKRHIWSLLNSSRCISRSRRKVTNYI